MVMDRETSHHQACSSPGHHHHPKVQKYPNCSPAHYSSPPPRPSIIQRNLSELSPSDLLLFAKKLKHPGITTLRLYVLPAEQEIVSRRFGDSDQRSTDNVFAFTRALANAIEGWMHSLELGMCLGSRDISSLSPAIRYSKALRHLSFANSGLGDGMLQVLASALQNCIPLRTLNLSGCSLTDASGSAITTIVKGKDLCVRLLPQKYKDTSPGEHRAPKYGQQWRQNVILMGKWSPAPAPGASNSREQHPTKSSTNVAGVVALDLSCNSFTDALSQELCAVLYRRPPLRALNLRCNRMTRLGAKPVLDVMKELSILRLVDMRGNKDECLLGVLENGEHYTTFSTFQAPFWMDAESLDPVICNPKKVPRSNAPEKRLRFTALSRPKVQMKGSTSAGQQLVNNIRGGGGGSRNVSTSSKTSMTSPTKPNHSNCAPRAVIPKPSCSGASPSRAPAERGSHSQKRPARFVRPATSPQAGRSSRQLPEKSSMFFDRQVTPSAHASQEYDGGRFMSPTVLEPPREHPMVQGPSAFWDPATTHDHIREMHHVNSKDGFHRTACTNEAKRSQSAVVGRGLGYPRDYQDFSRYQYNSRTSNISAWESPSRRWPADSRAMIYKGRSPESWQAGRSRSPEKYSPIPCLHRCKLLNDVQEQRKSRTCIQKADHTTAKRPYTPHLNQMLPKAALPLPEDKKELVEWKKFVKQIMTRTLLNLKDGFSQLIVPTEGAIAVVAQQAVTKLHQMPSSFFRSGMLRQLDRSCRVLNSHVASLAKRRKENIMRHLNAENQAPIVCGSEADKNESADHEDHQKVVRPKHDTNQKSTSRNVKHLGVQNTVHQNIVKQIDQVPMNITVKPIVVKHLVMQDQLIDHPKLPPLSISKGTNIP